MSGHWMCVALIASCIVVAASVAPGQERAGDQEKTRRNSAEDQKGAWQRLRALAGEWKSTDASGGGRVEQHYELVVQEKFLHARTASVSGGDNHEDWEIYSYDGNRDKVVLRQFVSEGFVNRYVLNEIADEGSKLVFVSEASENAPPGFRLRQTLTIEGDRRISQTLELAPEGKPFSQCAGNTLTRQRN